MNIESSKEKYIFVRKRETIFCIKFHKICFIRDDAKSCLIIPAYIVSMSCVCACVCKF